MHEVRRTPLPRTSVNMGEEWGRSRSFLAAPAPDSPLFGYLLCGMRSLQEAITFLGTENSEVLPEASVAIMACPVATFWKLLNVKEALPDASVVTDFCP